MAIDTIAVTGGNGKIGSAILEHLDEHGYETVNVSRGKRREEVSDAYVTTDLLDAGDTTADATTNELVEKFYPYVAVRDAPEGHETLFALSKAEELLGWEPQRSWRDL